MPFGKEHKKGGGEESLLPWVQRLITSKGNRGGVRVKVLRGVLILLGRDSGGPIFLKEVAFPLNTVNKSIPDISQR